MKKNFSTILFFVCSLMVFTLSPYIIQKQGILNTGALITMFLIIFPMYVVISTFTIFHKEVLSFGILAKNIIAMFLAFVPSIFIFYNGQIDTIIYPTIYTPFLIIANIFAMIGNKEKTLPEGSAE